MDHEVVVPPRTRRAKFPIAQSGFPTRAVVGEPQGAADSAFDAPSVCFGGSQVRRGPSVEDAQVV